MEIKGYFNDLKTATETVKRLKENGFEDAYIDTGSGDRKGGDPISDLVNVYGGDGLSNIAFNSGLEGIGSIGSPLNGENPMITNAGTTEDITDVNCCVVVNMEGGNQELAESIIINMGGSLEDPSQEAYKATARNDIQIERPKDQGNQIYTNRS